MGASQNNQNSGKMNGVAGTSSLGSTAPRKPSSEVCGFKCISKDQRIVRNCLDWAESLADMEEC